MMQHNLYLPFLPQEMELDLPLFVCHKPVSIIGL